MNGPAPFLRRPAALAVLLALGACAATTPFTPDSAARAPRLEGFGRSDIRVTTGSEAARRLFNDGVLQAYAFNEKEAVRMFKAALAQDPQCAMCAWGVAWQLGPTINDPGRGGAAEAVKYVDYALARTDRATPRERALVDAMALRYAHPSRQKDTAPLLGETCGKPAAAGAPHALDVAYADRMRAIAAEFPDDPDVLSLLAEAELVAAPEAAWDRVRGPQGRVGELLLRLEGAMGRHPEHTGIQHYMIHVADTLPVAARGVPAAERLARLAPAAPHLVHMPAHTFVHVGRYAEAARANERALAAEADLHRTEEAQGFTRSKDWRGHNAHFLWYATLMEGSEERALAATATLESLVEQADNTFGEYVRSLRLVTLLRTERWERVLAEPRPRGEKGLAAVMHEHARGVAQARLGRPDEAKAALDRLVPAATSLRTTYNGDSRGQKNLRAMADLAESRLRAELASARGEHAAALEHQRKAMEVAGRLDESEPPMFADGTRLTLAQLQARAGRWGDAEASYREALRERIGSGWALRGLVQALEAQGKRDEANRVRAELARAWREASPHLALK